MNHLKHISVYSILVFLCLITFSYSVLSTEYGYIRYNQTEIVNVIIACENSNGLPCNSSITCNLTHFYPNGTLWNYTEMGYMNLGFFNRTLGVVKFTGINLAYANCTDGKDNGTVDASFEIFDISVNDIYPASLNWSYPNSGGSHMYSGSYTINFTANFTDPNGRPIGGRIQIDSTNYTATNTTFMWYYAITGLSSGSHTFSWWMQDSNNTWSQSAIYTYIVYSDSGSSSGGGSSFTTIVNNYNNTNTTSLFNQDYVTAQITESNKKLLEYIIYIGIILAVLIILSNDKYREYVKGKIEGEFG
jgi:hypothetical protein